MTFEQLFPTLAPWVNNLANVWPAPIVKPNFAQWEVLHIVSLIVLGGCTILLGLRLAGRGLTSEPSSELYRQLRWPLHAGVIGIVLSGILIGMANAERLYNSEAFTAKMLALAGGLILTYLVARPAALAEGRVTTPVRIAAAVGLILWGGALWTFLKGGLIMPGLFHILTAAVLIVLFVLPGRARIVFGAGVAVILAGFYLATHVIIPADDLAKADPANLTIAWVLFAWIFGNLLFHFLRGSTDQADPRLAKVAGYAVILVWVTAGAAGRWIAFA